MSEIKDSGNRRKFDSGAVRDIAEGKGRMDLVPLDIVANLYSYIEENNNMTVRKFCPDMMLRMMNNFSESGDTHFIYYMLWSFINAYYDGDIETAILDVSVHYEEGAKKYCERNWEKGIPCHCYIDSAVRHCLKFLRGDKDERHDRAFMWNLLGLLWTIRHKEECNDLPYKVNPKRIVMNCKARSKRAERESVYKSILAELDRSEKYRNYQRTKKSVRLKIH